MADFLMPIFFGILLVILGYVNSKGDISSIHWYHRTHVSEEDRPIFGRLIGLGTSLIGVCIIVFGFLSFLSEKTQKDIFLLIGSALVILGCIIGLAISIYAMLKYNKGIFRFK